MRTMKDFLRIAAEQSAVDFGCSPEDFAADENRFLVSKPTSGARVYCPQPVLFDMATYGRNTVAAGREDLIEAARELFGGLAEPHELFGPEKLAGLDRLLREHGAKIGFASHFFLPDPALFPAFSDPAP